MEDRRNCLRDSHDAARRKRGMCSRRWRRHATNYVARGSAHRTWASPLERHARVARMALYNGFPPVRLYHGRLREAGGGYAARDGGAGRPEDERVLAVFDHLDAKSHGIDDRGRPINHASVQAAEHSGPICALVHRSTRSAAASPSKPSQLAETLDQRRAIYATLSSSDPEN